MMNEKRIAQEIIQIVNQSEKWSSPVITTLEELDTFWPAENYHQDYLQKNPRGYTCHFQRFDTYLS